MEFEVVRTRSGSGGAAGGEFDGQQHAYSPHPFESPVPVRVGGAIHFERSPRQHDSSPQRPPGGMQHAAFLDETLSFDPQVHGHGHGQPHPFEAAHSHRQHGFGSPQRQHPEHEHAFDRQQSEFGGPQLPSAASLEGLLSFAGAGEEGEDGEEVGMEMEGVEAAEAPGLGQQLVSSPAIGAAGGGGGGRLRGWVAPPSMLLSDTPSMPTSLSPPVMPLSASVPAPLSASMASAMAGAVTGGVPVSVSGPVGVSAVPMGRTLSGGAIGLGAGGGIDAGAGAAGRVGRGRAATVGSRGF
ncbi:hypothetical protein FB451DRAFT_276183 [Mycena latifolia]|nr:hypothetical protein FB451DRAFT_276183 [Mycena latifolia]